MKPIRAVLVIFLLGPSACIAPQPLRAGGGEAASAGASLDEQAAAHFQAQEWEKSVSAYQAIVTADPSKGEAWFRLGLSQRQLERFKDAAESYEQAEKRGYTSVQLLGSAAICRAQLQESDRAFEYLERAAAQGISLQFVNANPGLAPLRGDARFKAFAASVEKRAYPCAKDPKYREFDFWVGDWEVFSGGQKVGDNRIESILNGCLLFEQWTDVTGRNGKSFNYFDPAASKWKQNWVADGGNLVWYEGSVKDGSMHYLGELIKPDGTKQTDRVTLTPRADGTVRHLIETTADGGKTWTVNFDGTYVRRKIAEAAK